ncbi:hypothetical protein TURU_128083 [Turdus rufiventris]|nr:hypothetical protein TURU_128083 [Turdus rufiventris]
MKAWERDPGVAFAVKVGKHPLIVWAVCRLQNSSDDSAICLPFWVDTGSDVTVIPDIHWPLPWKLEETPVVGGVGGLSRAHKSTQPVAITLCTERGPGRTITLTTYVMSDCPPLLGRDALALLDIRIKICRDIKTLHDMQQLVGSLQWLRNIVLIPPKVMDPLNDLLKGKNPWEQKTLTLEAISSLNFIEH